MLKGLITFIVVILITSISYADSLTVSWENPDDSRVTGIYIYHSTIKEDVVNKTVEPLDVSIPTNQVTIDGLNYGDDFYVGATSHDDNNNESEMSKVLYTVVGQQYVPSPPSELKIINIE